MRYPVWLAMWAFALLAQGYQNKGGDRTIVRRQTNTPDVDSFIRRWQTSTTILGNRLYIDGGQLSQLVNGKENTPVRTSTVTLSIPLDSSWTNETLVMTEIPKFIHSNVYVPTLWADEKNSAIYSYNGDKIGSNSSHTSVRTLYKFNPDGRGAGAWGTSEAANSWELTALLRSARSAVVTCNGKGFAFGGYANSGTDDRLGSSSVPLAGMVTYDFETKHWTNVSIAPLMEHLGGRVPTNGHGVCLPTLGESGALMFLAGGAWAYGEESSSPIPLGNMTFYDIKSGTWHWQTTTGDLPEHRRDACATIAHGKDGSYEVFLFGGMPITGSSNARGDMWVLSMPGFKWFKIDPEVTPGRGFGSCASKGRQLIMTAGTAKVSGDQWKEENKDPWNQGIGVFDMTALEWRSSYDHQLGDYDSPKIVQDWYSSGGAPHWDDGGMQRLFESTSSDPSNPSNPTSVPSEASSESSSSNAGVIAGATVGGVAALAIIGALIWFLRKRKSRKQTGRAELDGPPVAQPGYPSTVGSPSPNLTDYHVKHGTTSPYTASTSPYPISELSPETRSQPAELAEQRRSSELAVNNEMGAPQYIHEMQGDDVRQGNYLQGGNHSYR